MKIRQVKQNIAVPVFQARPPVNNHDFHVQTITPTYGGGVKAGEPDRKMPVRATAIRGQLRFWWRLLKRQEYTENGQVNYAKLFQKESEIWGKMSEKGDEMPAKQVKIRVCHIPKIQVDRCAEHPPKRNGGGVRSVPDFKHGIPSYALFPAQGKVERGQVTEYPHNVILVGMTFTLAIECSKELWESDIKQALRFWASFGGLGARTRRGLGSVEVKDLLTNKVLDRVTEEQAKKIGCCLITFTLDDKKDAVSAWNKAIARLQTFRQAVGVGRNSGQQPNRPGRSRWPEPDAIRRILNNHCTLHPPEHPAGNVFPRAAFGLPIIFKFKDDNAGDPPQSSLQPHGFERMASPLILKAMALGDGKYAAIALRLPELEITGKTLDLNGHQIDAWWPTDPIEAHGKAQQIRPLQNRPQNEDVLAAFLQFFKEGR